MYILANIYTQKFPKFGNFYTQYSDIIYEKNFYNGRIRIMDDTDGSAKKIFIYMKEIIEEYLDYINTMGNLENDDFTYGEKTAYVECLEMMQLWKGAKEIGLDYNIEERYPL